jgi:predicted CXXCH cytochrome family protein
VSAWRWLAGCGGLAGVVLTGGLISSCSSVGPIAEVPLQIEGASYVGNQACYECHTNISRVFPVSTHGRSHREHLKMAGESGCESCHGPGSRHVEVGGGRGKFIINPGRDPEACFRCHIDVHAQFDLPQHHPVLEGKLNCIQCHDPHGRDIMKPAGGLAMARLNQTCAQCHRAQARPFVFEHPALREGCLVCHNPHGSINAKMLVQADPNLCLKCHAQEQKPGSAGGIFIGKVQHKTFLAQGTCWSAGCHNAVHGSNMSRELRY